MASDAQMLEGVGEYKYGFRDKENYVFKSRKGLDREIVEQISAMKGEPKWMLDFRLKAFEHFQKRPMPTWGADLRGLNFDDIFFYVKPTEGQGRSWEDVPDTIKNTFDKLGIPEAERKFLAGVGAQYECLSGDTRVYTARGVIPIREISDQDVVFSLDDALGAIIPSPVKGIMPKGVRQVFEVRAGTHKLHATANHPFLVLENQREVGRQGGRYKRTWKYLHDIQVGDLVAIAKALPDVGQPHQLEIPSIELNGRHNPIELPESTSTDLMWWLGLYIGDGFIHREKQKARVEFAIPETERSLRQELASVTNRLFDIPTQTSDRYRMTIGSTIIARYLMANGFSGGSLEKRIPEWVATLPQEQVHAFLEGYIASDGCVHDRIGSHDIFPTSGNEALIEDICDLASLCGVPTSSIHRFRSKHPIDNSRENVGYRMSLGGDYEGLGCRSDQRLAQQEKHKFWHDDSGAENTAFRKHGNEWFGFVRVDSIEPAGQEPVFDIEVNGPHNFVAEGLIVHNSEMVYHSIQEHLEKLGVIFLSIEDGLRKHPDLFREYFGTVIPIEDNKLAALNSAVWSGGSFVYVPKGVKVDLPLQAYFRLNAANMGQFERSLIIVDEGADLHYVEGCFLKGARVRTRAGEKPIEQIALGDEVLTHLGRWRKVYHLSRRPYHGAIYRIRYTGDSQRELNVTAEHPLLVVRRRNGSWQNHSFRLMWSRADRVRVGDYLAVPVPQSVSVPVPIRQWKAQNSDELPGIESHIPEWASDTHPETLIQWVKWMWRSGGSYDTQRHLFTFSTNTEPVAYDIRDTLLQLGIAASVAKQTHSAANQNRYTVEIVTSFNSRFGTVVGMEAPDAAVEKTNIVLDTNFQYMPVNSITQDEDETQVYNFSVEEDESYVAEGVVSHNCTAPQYTTDSFHSGVIEIVVKRGARSRYTTIQNWSTNVYNLVTQRAKVYADASHDWTDANIGSKVTMKYPSCYLMEPGAHGEMLSMAFAGPGQHQDAGSKMVHFAPYTTSKVTSKSISKGGGRSSYRGLVKIYKDAKGARSNASCDALLLDPQSRSDTYPTIEIDEDDVTIGHEASVSKIGEEQLFYLMSRGLSQEDATTMVVAGFIEPLVKELPMEYAVEMNRLIQLQMSGSVG